jgi:hypothetical protein
MVTREQLLGIELQTETVEVAGLGPLTIRELTQDEYADWVAEWASQKDGQVTVDNRLYCASLLQRCVLNGDGEPMFTPDDVPRLARMPARVTRPLIQAAERLNGIGAEVMRDTKKNSDSGQDGSISTSSPATSVSGT